MVDTGRYVYTGWVEDHRPTVAWEASDGTWTHRGFRYTADELAERFGFDWATKTVYDAYGQEVRR